MPRGVRANVNSWREQRLAVEIDGYRHHRGRAAFEADRAKDAALGRLGFRVLRLTYRQVLGEAAGVAVAIRRMLSERR